MPEAEDPTDEPFEPNWVIPPAEHIPEQLEAAGVSPEDFAQYLKDNQCFGMTPEELEKFLKGDHPLTPLFADGLVKLLQRGDVQYWLNLEANFQKDSARIAIVEKVAIAIYSHDGGCTDEEYIQLTGKPRRIWKTDKPWDSQPEEELCEHERDDYRVMARAAIKAFKTSS